MMPSCSCPSTQPCSEANEKNLKAFDKSCITKDTHTQLLNSVNINATNATYYINTATQFTMIRHKTIKKLCNPSSLFYYWQLCNNLMLIKCFVPDQCLCHRNTSSQDHSVPLDFPKYTIHPLNYKYWLQMIMNTKSYYVLVIWYVILCSG